MSRFWKHSLVGRYLEFRPQSSQPQGLPAGDVLGYATFDPGGDGRELPAAFRCLESQVRHLPRGGKWDDPIPGPMCEVVGIIKLEQFGRGEPTKNHVLQKAEQIAESFCPAHPDYGKGGADLESAHMKLQPDASKNGTGSPGVPAQRGSASRSPALT